MAQQPPNESKADENIKRIDGDLATVELQKVCVETQLVKRKLNKNMV